MKVLDSNTSCSSTGTQYQYTDLMVLHVIWSTAVYFIHETCFCNCIVFLGIF